MGSNPEFVDDRDADQDWLEENVAQPDAFDKVGDPVRGRMDPGRCHVCLAWVARPFNERTLTVCPSCHEKGPGERDLVRERVRDALSDVWEGSA